MTFAITAAFYEIDEKLFPTLLKSSSLMILRRNYTGLVSLKLVQIQLFEVTGLLVRVSTRHTHTQVLKAGNKYCKVYTELNVLLDINK